MDSISCKSVVSCIFGIVYEVSIVLSLKQPCFFHRYRSCVLLHLRAIYSINKLSTSLSIECIACSVFENGFNGDRSVRWIRSDCMCNPASLLNALPWEQHAALLLMVDSFLFIHFFQSNVFLLAIGFTWEMWKWLIALHSTSLLTIWFLLQIEHDSTHIWKEHCSPFAHHILWSLMQQELLRKQNTFIIVGT